VVDIAAEFERRGIDFFGWHFQATFEAGAFDQTGFDLFEGLCWVTG